MRHLVLFLLVALPLLAIGCGDPEAIEVDASGEAMTVSDTGHGEAGHDCGACSRGKDGGTAWCDGCDKGYVKGVETSDKTSVEAALAAETAESGEETCSCARGKEGETVWCDQCGHGYVAGEKVGDKAAVEAVLAANIGTPADGHACACSRPEGPGTMWCDHCGKGFIEGVETADKGAVDAALAAR